MDFRKLDVSDISVFFLLHQLSWRLLSANRQQLILKEEEKRQKEQKQNKCRSIIQSILETFSFISLYSLIIFFNIIQLQKRGLQKNSSESIINFLSPTLTIMKKMIIDSIQQLKRQHPINKSSQSGQKDNIQQSNTSKQSMKDSPKRPHPSQDYTHRSQPYQSKSNMYNQYSFCFPIIDLQLTPKQIDLLTQSIIASKGRVLKYTGKTMSNIIVDFLLVNPKMNIETLRSKVDSKISYREIVDYHFIIDSNRANYLLNIEKYSLYVNVDFLGFGEKEGIPNTPSKKIKKNEKYEEDSDITVKLSDEEYECPKIVVRPPIQDEKSIPFSEKSGQKVDMEELYLHENLKINNFSMNEFIAVELQKLMKIYATQRDMGRRLAYMKAAAAIRALDKQIESDKDVENLRGIGDKIQKKIKELLQTGHINKLDTLQMDEKNIVGEELCKIWGIGPSKANQLFHLGIKSIEQLKKRPDLLNKNQKIGLKYYDDFQKKIPREKVTRMFELVRNVIETMVADINAYRVEICGSYRRGRAMCGDMDIIISRKDGVFEKNFVNDLTKQLESIGFLTDHLGRPKVSDEKSSISYMGVCRFQDSTHHRIDIKYYPVEEYAYALLHFTGSKNFNRMLRLHTMKLGLQLSDKGAIPKAEKGIIWTKHIPVCYSEKDIFDFLGLAYKTPVQRDI